MKTSIGNIFNIHWLISLIFISILFLPNIQINDLIFIRPEDVLIFSAFIILIIKEYPRLSLPKTSYMSILLVYLSWMFLTVLFKAQIMNTGAIFELIKFIKVILMFILVYKFFPIYKEHLEKLFTRLFLGISIYQSISIF